MPPLQSIGQFTSDWWVKRLETCLKKGEPRMDPGVDGHCVSQRVPVIHLKKQKIGLKKTLLAMQKDPQICDIK